MMTHPHVNPLAKGPKKAAEKMYFGTMRVIANEVRLVKGASYAEAGLLNTDGSPYEFRGKMRAASSDPAEEVSTHIIVVIQCRNKMGIAYNAFRDFLHWEGNQAQEITMPSLRRFFGEEYEGIWGKSAEVKASIVEFDDRGYTKQALQIEEVYKNRHEREAAELAHFAQFSQPSVEDDPIPFGDEEENEPQAVGMTRQEAVNALPNLFKTIGQDETKFRELLNGMPVILKALGDDFEHEVTEAMAPF